MVVQSCCLNARIVDMSIEQVVLIVRGIVLVEVATMLAGHVQIIHLVIVIAPAPNC